MKTEHCGFWNGMCLAAVVLSSIGNGSCLEAESESIPSAEREVQKQRRIREQAEKDAEIIEYAADLERRRESAGMAIYLRLIVRQGLPYHIRPIKLGQNHGKESFSLQDYTVEEVRLVDLAGELRAACCADLLLNRIAKKAVPKPWGDPTTKPMELYDRYPAFQALGRIGPDAAEPTLNRIMLEDDPTARRLMTTLLSHYWGTDVAIKRLTGRLANLQVEAQRQRVTEAIQQLDDAEPSKP